MAQICVSKLVGEKPSHYLNQFWNNVSVYWTLRNKLKWNLNQDSWIFIRENAFKNVVCEKAVILSRSQCVMWMSVIWLRDTIPRHPGHDSSPVVWDMPQNYSTISDHCSQDHDSHRMAEPWRGWLWVWDSEQLIRSIETPTFYLNTSKYHLIDVATRTQARLQIWIYMICIDLIWLNYTDVILFYDALGSLAGITLCIHAIRQSEPVLYWNAGSGWLIAYTE